MLTFAVILTIVLAVVTVVGHGIWVTLAAIFRALGGHSSSPSSISAANKPNSPSSKPNLRDDLEALRRLVGFFRRQSLIDENEADRLIKLAERASQSDARVSSTIASSRPELSGAVQIELVKAELVTAQSQPPSQQPAVSPLDTTTSDLQPVLQSSATQQQVDDSLPQQKPTPVKQPASLQPAKNRALSEILQSFLVAHNIRWGELTAGILIVVCSIGLVISLWNTLTQTNRLIPAAIFLTAVAGIEAAGLYTLNRWKLRHTSRAVLIIATMLIPLSMMAGVSIAGRGEGAVSLSSWSTWIAIGASWLITGSMLYFAGRALVGKHRTVGWLTALGVPTFMLPIVPAAVRSLGGQTHWLLLATSILAFICMLRETYRIRVGNGRRILSAKHQHIYLFCGLAVYSVVMLAAMLLLRFELSLQLVVIAGIAITPALYGMLSVLSSLHSTELTSGRRIQATSVYLICSVLIMSLFPLIVARTVWLEYWLGALFVTALISVITTRQRSHLAWLSISMALALPPLATIWGGGFTDDNSLLLWQRYVSGYGAITMLTLGLASIAGATWLLPISPRGNTTGRMDTNFNPSSLIQSDWLVQLGLVITACGTVLVALVGLGPEAWLIGLPRPVITGLLFAASIVVAVVLRFHRQVPIIAAIPIMVAWSTVFLTSATWWAAGSDFLLPAVCKILSATTLSIIILGEVLSSLRRFGSGRERFHLARNNWWQTAAGLSLFALLPSILYVTQPGPIATITVSIATGVLTLAVLRGCLSSLTPIASLTNWLASILIVHHLRPEWLRMDEPQNLVNALTVLFLLLGITAFAWQVLRVVGVKVKATCGWLIALKHDRVQLDSHINSVLVWGYVVAAVWQLAVCMVRHAAGQTDLATIALQWVIPVTALVGSLLMIRYAKHLFNIRLSRKKLYLEESIFDRVLATTVFGLVAPVALISIYIPSDNTLRLIFCGWTAFIGVIALSAWYWKLGCKPIVENTEAAERKTYLGYLINSVTIVGLVMVAGSCAALIRNPEWQAQNDVGITSWINVSLVLLPTLFIVYVVTLSEFTKNEVLVACYQFLTIILGPFVVFVVYPNATVFHYAQAAIAACLVLYIGIRIAVLILANRAVSQLGIANLKWQSPTTELAFDMARHGRFACQLSCAALAIVAAAWTLSSLNLTGIHLLKPSEPALSWLILYAIGAVIVVNQNVVDLVKDPKASGSLTRSTAMIESLFIHASVLLGAGLFANSLLQLNWLPQTFAQSVTASQIVITIWMGSAWIAAWQGFRQRNLSLASLSTGLLIVVNLWCVLVSLTSNIALVEWLWLLAMLSLNVAGLLWYYSLERSQVGQTLSVASFISASLLLSTLTLGSPNLFCLITIAAAIFAFVWAMSDLVVQLRMNKLSSPERSHAPAIISGLSSLACVMGAGVTFDTLRLGFNIDSAHAILNNVTVGLTFVICAATYVLAPRRTTATLIAFTATQLLTALAIASTLHLVPTIDRWIVVAVAATCISGLWVWAWPLLRAYLFSDNQATKQQLSLALLISILALLTLIVSSHCVLASGDQTSKSLAIASVLGSALVIGISFGWWKDKELQSYNFVDQLPTYSVLLFASGLLLAAIGLINVEDPTNLILCMRVFIAAIILTPSMLWVARKVFALQGEHWEVALRRGTYLGCGLATFSLFSMFVGELRYWGDLQLANLPSSLVFGVAALISAACALCSLCAIFPHSVKSVIGDLNETQRTAIIFTAQVLGGLAWLHVVLCRPQIAWFGLRPYWPFTVMVLAFLSAGLTQFARVRRDDVLERAMLKSTFLLPLVPVIGFWFARHESGWMYLGERSSYTLLLFIGAVFYGLVAVSWPKYRLPKAMGLLLGNAALWVVMAQTPSLSFFSHPQFWLIPPAVCVLLATFVEQRNAPVELTTGLRYASLFVIYISSTADVILDQTGASFWRPIVLILLALFGMSVGVLTKTKAFLYLGTLFVFIGVLSMVWQAGRAIDQSWPWWVFGITMGVIILAGLTFLEKNRAALKRVANELAGWQP